MNVERLAVKPYRTKDERLYEGGDFHIIVLDEDWKCIDTIGTAHQAKDKGWTTWAFMSGEHAEGPPVFEDVQAKTLLKLLKKVAKQLNEEDYSG